MKDLDKDKYKFTALNGDIFTIDADSDIVEDIHNMQIKGALYINGEQVDAEKFRNRKGT